MSEELGDHLRKLADADGSEPGHRPSHESSQPPVEAGDDDAHDDDDYIAAELEDESGEEPAPHETGFAAAGIHAPLQDQNPSFAGQQPAYRPLPPAGTGKKKTSEFKAIAAPILMTVGVMLLIPAFWAVLVLTGAGVPMADREDASGMAKVMLLCWPLALSLIIPAVLIFAQLAAEKKTARVV